MVWRRSSSSAGLNSRSVSLLPRAVRRTWSFCMKPWLIHVVRLGLVRMSQSRIIASDRKWSLCNGPKFCVPKNTKGNRSQEVLSCIRSGLDLLFATDNKVRAKEFAQAPPNKKHLVLWTRVAPDIRKTLLADIPLGFRLEETLLGAVAKLPGVEDLEGCSWAAQKSMWASNSASLIQEMMGGSEVYFVSGINLLGRKRKALWQHCRLQVGIAAALSQARSCSATHSGEPASWNRCRSLVHRSATGFGGCLESFTILQVLNNY